MIAIKSYPGFVCYVIFAVIGSIVNSGILAYYIASEIKRKLNNTNDGSNDIDSKNSNVRISVKLYRYSLLSAFIFYCINSLQDAINLLSSVISSSHQFVMECNVFVVIATLTYVFGIGSLNAALICRLHIAFNNSAYAYSKRLIYSLFVTLIVVCLSMAIASLFVIDCEVITVSHNSVNYYPQNISFPLWYSALISFFILVLSIVIVYLFVKPLRQMVKNVQLSKNGIVDPMQKLAIKAGVTSVTALTTSILAMVCMALFGGSIFIRIDITLNSLCLACQYQSFDWLYRRLFCCVKSYLQRMERKVQMEMGTNMASSDISL